MNLGDLLDATPTTAVAVVLTTATMYLLLVLVLRVWGPRLFANPSSRTTATVVVLGAIVGRSGLGLRPNLEAGVLALATVLVLTALLQTVSRGSRGGRASRRVEALVVEGEVCTEALRRHGLTEADLWTRLRESGTGSLAGVALALLERNGSVSVLRSGTALQRAAVADVRDCESLPASLFGEG